MLVGAQRVRHPGRGQRDGRRGARSVRSRRLSSRSRSRRQIDGGQRAERPHEGRLASQQLEFAAQPVGGGGCSSRPCRSGRSSTTAAATRYDDDLRLVGQLGHLDPEAFPVRREPPDHPPGEGGDVAVAVLLGDEVHEAGVVRRAGAVVEARQPKPRLADRHQVEAAVRVRRHLAQLGGAADRVQGAAPSAPTSRPDRMATTPNRRSASSGSSSRACDQHAVARLEDVQRQHESRHQDGVQREEGQARRHGHRLDARDPRRIARGVGGTVRAGAGREAARPDST